VLSLVGINPSYRKLRNGGTLLPILAAFVTGIIALLVAVANPAAASTAHYAGCTEVGGVWNVGISTNGYMCAIQYRAASGIAYLRVTGETGTYTWDKLGSGTSATGTQIPVSPNNGVYCGVIGSHPYLLIPGVKYDWESTCTYHLLSTSVGRVLKLVTNGLSMKFLLKPGTAPASSTLIAWG
jgi:hypothetical protein